MLKMVMQRAVTAEAFGSLMNGHEMTVHDDCGPGPFVRTTRIGLITEKRHVLSNYLAIFLWLCALFTASATARADEDGEEEQQVTDGAEGRPVEKTKAPDVVQNRRFYKAHRLELFPHAYASVLNNSFANRFLAFSGASVAYHFRETIFLEANLEIFPHFVGYDDLKALNYAIAVYVEDGDYIPSVRKESSVVGGAIGWSPFYGKINLVGFYVQNFDVSALFGMNVLRIRTDQYQAISDPVTLAPALQLVASETASKAAPSLGLAARFFVNRWLTVRTDLRGYAYLDKVNDYSAEAEAELAVTGVRPQRTILRNSLILGVGLSGFFPIRN